MTAGEPGDFREWLEAGERSFRLLVESVRDYAIFMLDPQGRIASWNVGAERIKGYAAAEVLGRHFRLFYTKEAQDRGWPDHELVVARREGRFEDEGWRVRKDGTRFWANVIITALRAEDGRVIGFAKVTRDLTQRRKVEALEEAGRQTIHFLAMLGHELRNPLAPIRNAVEVMRSAPLGDPRVEKARDIIERQVTHLGRLVDDLLDVSRIKSGKVVVAREPVDLVEIVARAAEAARGSIDARGQELVLELPAAPVHVSGDATRLAQVVVNLLSNACKYTPEGGHIQLTLEREDGHVQLRVHDDGIGIAGDLLPRLFDPFVQGERGLERAEGGLGLGLTLVRTLVELHDGTVSASSPGPDMGSEFLVRLPAVAPPDDAGQAAGPPARELDPRRILVVDDNEDSAETLAMLLAAWGHDARTALDGPSALEAALRDRPDVVLMDLGLPGMDGYEVAERLLAELGEQAPVLAAVTGYGQEEDRERSRQAGFSMHLVKPLDTDSLRQLLAALPPLRRP